MLESQADVQVRATADPVVAKVAQPIEFRVRVEAPPSTPIEFPDLANDFGPFQVTGASDVTLQRGEMHNVWLKTWTLECLQSGDHTIPSIDVRAGDSSMIATSTISVKVESTLPDDRRSGPVDPAWIGPLEPEHDFPAEPSRSNHGWLLATILMACVVIAALVWRRRNLRSSPRQEMIRRLDQLQSESEESPSEAIIGLLDAWRRYLSETLGLPTAGMTASELVEAVETALGETKTGVLRECSVMAERSAYAGAPVARETVIQLIERTRHWVLSSERFIDRRGNR